MPFFFLKIWRPPRSTLFPYPTAFGSGGGLHRGGGGGARPGGRRRLHVARGEPQDRKSTRLNSSHTIISYAVFFFKDLATTEIYTLSLPDRFRIWGRPTSGRGWGSAAWWSPATACRAWRAPRSEEHTSELQSHDNLVCRFFF